MVSAGRLTALNLRPERIQSMAKNFIRVLIVFVAVWNLAALLLLPTYLFMAQIQDANSCVNKKSNDLVMRAYDKHKQPSCTRPLDTIE